MCISLADLRRGVVAEGLREVRLVGEDGLGVLLRGRLGLGLGLGSALAVFLGLGVLLFLTFLCDPRATTARRAQEKRQVDAVHARPLALLAVALAVEISPLLLGRLLLGRLRGRDLRGDGVTGKIHELRTGRDIGTRHVSPLCLAAREIWAIPEPQVGFKLCSSFTRQATREINCARTLYDK